MASDALQRAALAALVTNYIQTRVLSYTAAGTHTITVPDDVTQLLVQAIGGGGGSSEAGLSGGGQGGGGGAFASGTVTVTPGATYNVVVGAGGAGHASGATGGAGGNSYFDAGADVKAKGGSPGYNGSGDGLGGQAEQLSWDRQALGRYWWLQRRRRRRQRRRLFCWPDCGRRQRRQRRSQRGRGRRHSSCRRRGRRGRGVRLSFAH